MRIPAVGGTAAFVLVVVLSMGLSMGVVPSPSPAVAESEPAVAGPIDRFVEDWMRANAVPGLALTVTRGATTIHLKGYGDAGDGRPVTADTPFLIASLSKSFTALAVLQLSEAGRIDLDTPVRAYLPGFAVADPSASGRITVRMLLNHTSGLADAGYPEMTLPQPDTIAARVAGLRDAHPVDPPGTAFHYFNPNYAVLARLVEVVAAQPFSEYLRQRVLMPLGMTATTSVVTSGDASEVAPGLAGGHILAFGVPIAREELLGFLGGSGGVISTARDLAPWLEMQGQGGRFAGRSLLSPGGIDMMRTPPAGVDTTYGMGWARRARQPSGVEHTGVLSTFSAHQALLTDDGIGIAFLANTYNGLIDFAGLMQGLADLTTTGTDAEVAAGFGARRLGLVFGVSTIGVIAVAGWRFRRLPGWADRCRGRPARTAVGVVLPFAPAAVALSTPSLVARLSDRVFGWRVLFLAIPDLMGCLTLAGVLGAALGIARLISIARRRDPLRDQAGVAR
ncbi:MAG: serine hydrolase domain-containing protein [Kineosporiaceae bacterium]